MVLGAHTRNCSGYLDTFQPGSCSSRARLRPCHTRTALERAPLPLPDRFIFSRGFSSWICPLPLLELPRGSQGVSEGLRRNLCQLRGWKNPTGSGKGLLESVLRGCPEGSAASRGADPSPGLAFLPGWEPKVSSPQFCWATAAHPRENPGYRGQK